LYSKAFAALLSFAAMAADISAVPLFAQDHSVRGPVSVTLERKSVQTLADGTHITRVTHEIFIRDSKGRVRTEREVGPLPGAEVSLRTVSVTDPVEGVGYSWQVGAPGGRKTYSVWRRPAPTNAGSNSPMRTLPDGTNAARQGAMGSASGSSGGSAPVSLSIPAVVNSSVVPGGAVQPAVTRDPLGMRVISGLTCVAQRTTTVYAIGFLGNDRTITTTDETCTSEEAGRVIEETREDPRTGVQTVTLLSGSLLEPDVSLFSPPSDYTEFKQPVRTPQR